MKRALVPLAILLVGVFLYGMFAGVGGPKASLEIVSGSENRGLEPIITAWAEDEGYDVSVTYLGSVDISRELAKGTEGAFDAVWPAHSLWIELGDTNRVVKHRESILRSPVVLGLRDSVAEDLGWKGRTDITIQMIAEAATNNAFRLAMTSATQSNSGASAYIGFLYALAGDPDVLTAENLNDPAVQEGVRALLGQVDRSSGSSGWLADSLVANPEAYDAMFNYEAIVLEANAELARAGKEPLYLIYPANGLSVADSPLGYVDKGDAAKEEAFLALQQHLLTSETQGELIAAGRRAGLLGLAADQADPAVWNPVWGVDLSRAIAPVPTPESAVIAEALRLYQTELRKPSLTVWVLDISGSMEGQPLDQLKQAMNLLLDADAAAVNLLQPSSRDVTIIIPFNHTVEDRLTLAGSDRAELNKGLTLVRGLQAGGGTDLYYALGQAYEQLRPYYENDTLFDYLPAIVAMTDGASEIDNRQPLFNYVDSLGFAKDIPVHAIAFGAADEEQLRELNERSIGRLFKAGSDLAKALRSAKGYN